MLDVIIIVIISFCGCPGRSVLVMDDSLTEVKSGVADYVVMSCCWRSTLRSSPVRSERNPVMDIAD